MSQVVYKYPVDFNEMEVQLPKEAKVLDVQVQREEAQMWVLLDPDAPTITRRFVIYPTGSPIETEEGKRLDYIGTFQLNRGYLVFHLFEEAPNDNH